MPSIQTNDTSAYSIDVINVFFTFFYSGHVFTFLTFFKNFFPRFLFKKTLSRAKYAYAKIQR